MTSTNALRFQQWFGAAGGLTGTVLIALNNTYSGWGFVFYLASNLSWICFGLASRIPGLTTQHLLYLPSSLIGIWCWLIAPRLSLSGALPAPLELAARMWHQLLAALT